MSCLTNAPRVPAKDADRRPPPPRSWLALFNSVGPLRSLYAPLRCMPCPASTCSALACPACVVLSPRVVPYHSVPFHAVPCRVTAPAPCHGIPRLAVSYHSTPCPAVSCLVDPFCYLFWHPELYQPVLCTFIDVLPCLALTCRPVSYSMSPRPVYCRSMPCIPVSYRPMPPRPVHVSF